MSTDATYLWLNDQQAGPFTALQLRSMWTAGTITAATLYWQEGMEEWVPVGNAVEEAIAAEKQAPVARVIRKNVQAAPKKPERQVNVLWFTLLAAFIFFGLVLAAVYGEDHGWWILPVIDFSPGKVMVGLFALLAGITVVGNELGKPNGVWRSISFVVIFGFLLKGCVFTDRTHEERPPVSASSSEAHDYRDGFNIGLEVGKKNGRPGSGYSIPTKEGLFQLSAFALMGHSPSDKQEFMRGWRDGYKLGFQQTSEKAF